MSQYVTDSKNRHTMTNNQLPQCLATWHGTLHIQQLQTEVQDREKRRCDRSLYLDTGQETRGIKVRSPA